MSPKFRAALVLCLAMLVVALPSSAQVVASDAYQLGYYIHFGIEEQIKIINTGQIGSPIDAATQHGTVCASIYVFDSNQEMISCCSCPVTANGLLSVEAFALTVNALTGFPPAQTGVVKVVADRAASCDARTISSPVEGGLRATIAHNQGTAEVVCSGSSCGVAFTSAPAANETEFQRAPLTQTEQTFLGNTCSFVLYLGSGRGRCFCPGDAG